MLFVSAEVEVKGQKPNSFSEFYYKKNWLPHGSHPWFSEGGRNLCDVEGNGEREKWQGDFHSPQFTHAFWHDHSQKTQTF